MRDGNANRRRGLKRTALCLLVCFVLFAFASSVYATGSAVTIVSPSEETLAGDNIFLSVKVTEPIPIRVLVDFVTDGEAVSVREPVTKEGTLSLWYYTERLSDLAPGLYCVTVETKNENGNFVATDAAYVILGVEAADESVDIEAASASELSVFRRLLQKIIRLFAR